jgi:hypothetical protein
MINFLIVLFIISLIYLAKVEMVKSYFTLMALQGVLLFGLAYFELKEIDLVHLLFILLETLVCTLVFTASHKKPNSPPSQCSHKRVLFCVDHGRDHH